MYISAESDFKIAISSDDTILLQLTLALKIKID